MDDEGLRRLSARLEFLIVVGLAFGPFLLDNLTLLVSPSPPATIQAGHLDALLLHESIVLLLLAVFLRWRGWTPDRLGLRAHRHDLPIAIGLAVLVNLVFTTLHHLIEATGTPLPSIEDVMPIAQGLGHLRVLAVSAVNGTYEELFVCGYLISALRERRSVGTAVAVSTAIRLGYHLYQGSLGVIGIVPMGLIFAFWYARTGRLWPLILAHALLDVWPLAAYA